MSASIIASSRQPDVSEVGLNKEYASFQMGDNSMALYRIALLVDPLSEYGQK